MDHKQRSRSDLLNLWNETNAEKLRQQNRQKQTLILKYFRNRIGNSKSEWGSVGA
jgi:hypothetical protein